MTPNHSIFVVAGEASADMHAASLVRELKRSNPELQFFGVGGKELAANGMEICVNAEALNVVGGSDWFDKISEVIGVYRKLSKLIRHRRPACAILLDLPDFNLRMAKKLKRLGVPVVYYISPQVWAWRKYRVNTIRKFVDRMLVVFPFEKEFYESRGVPVSFVGHPLLDSIQPRNHYRDPSLRLQSPRIAVLPGSRSSELNYHAPILNDFIKMIYEKYPAAEVRIPVASTLSVAVVREAIPDLRVRLEERVSRETIAWADVAMVASGTATLETALIGTPFCLFYKLSPSSAFFFQRVWRYKGFLGMPNLLHGDEVVRELFQQEATATNLIRECSQLIENENYRQKAIENLLECHRKLGSSGASSRAAVQVLEVLAKEAKTRDLVGSHSVSFT